MISEKDLQAIKDRYGFYPDKVQKHTSVYHVRQLLAEIERLKKQAS